jgi:hypothetical protein
MANNQNLKPFPKGVSGNPKGAPKTKLLKDVLTAELQTESNGIDKLTAIINKLTTMAVKGDMNAIKEVLDRYAGKSVQHNIVEAVEKIEPITFKII